MNRLSDPELGTYTDCAMAPLDAVEVMPDCSPWEETTPCTPPDQRSKLVVGLELAQEKAACG